MNEYNENMRSIHLHDFDYWRWHCMRSLILCAAFRPIRNASLETESAYEKVLFLFFFLISFYAVRNILIIGGNKQYKRHLYNEWKYQEGNENAHKIVKNSRGTKSNDIKWKNAGHIFAYRCMCAHSLHCIYVVYSEDPSTIQPTDRCAYGWETCIFQSWAIKTQNRYEPKQEEEAAEWGE